MSDFQNRIVTVVNKTMNVGQAMNALGHAAIALGSKVGSEILELIDYQDADGNIYQNISRMPFIVLQANSNKIKELRKNAIANNIEHVTFTDTMTIGTWQEQVARSLQTKEDNLIFYAIVLLGNAEIVTEMTRKFSLWK